MKQLKAVLLYLLLLMTVPAQSQPMCNVRTFSIRDGLAANFISDIKQDKDGLIWVSTYNGLCCYDGYEFQSFRARRGPEEALTSNRIIEIHPNSAGNIWCIAYDRNLCLYDTHECCFKNITEVIVEKLNMRLLPRRMFCMDNGYTWIVCDEGLHAILRINDSKADSPEGIQLYWFDRHGIEASRIINILADSHGMEWILTDAGVINYTTSQSFPTPYRFLVEIGETVYFVSRDGNIASWDANEREIVGKYAIAGVGRVNDVLSMDGVMVLATDQGVVYCDVNSGKQQLVSIQSPSQPSPEVTAIKIDSKNRVWASAPTDGITMIDAQRNAHYLSPADPQGFMGMKNGKDVLWHEDRYGTVWLVPHGGNFCYYDEESGTLVGRTLRSMGYEESNIPAIWLQLYDMQKNLWISSNHDLSFIRFGRCTVKQVNRLPKGEESRSLLVDSEGLLWAGSNNGYVMVVKNDGNTVGYLSPSGKLQSTPIKLSNRVYALYEDNKHRKWIGTKGDGLYCLTSDGRMTHFLNDTANVYSLSHNNIYSIDQDELGHIWVGTYEAGLNLVDEQADGTIRFINGNNDFTYYDNQRFNRIRRITHNGKGVVIVSTTGGIVTFSNDFKDPSAIKFYGTIHLKGDTTSLASSDVLQTLVTKSGRVLVATMGEGMQEIIDKDLLRDRLSLRSIHQIGAREGNVLSMVEDNDGGVWVTRETTINYFNPANDSVMRLGPGEIGEKVEFAESNSIVDKAFNRVFMGTVGGYVMFVPDELKQNNHFCPSIVFTAYRTNGAESDLPLLNRGRLQVPSGLASLVVRFAAIDYAENFRVRYSYWLEGYDDQWVNLGRGIHEATFTHLPAGDYVLHVRSTNVRGEWQDNEATLSIEVQAAFTESIWGKLLMAIAAIAVIALLFWYYRKRK